MKTFAKVAGEDLAFFESILPDASFPAGTFQAIMNMMK